MRITLISDTHNRHKQLNSHLPGGDILIHAGDISSMGYEHEVKEFCKWFNKIDNYDSKIFIAGNHDWLFQNSPILAQEIVSSYKTITYLQDDFVYIGDDAQNIVKIYGSPWQPRFYNWAFNADRGDDIKQYWDKIPKDTDILITHGPAFGYLDSSPGMCSRVGCEDLYNCISSIKPKIFVCGHIHSGYGHVFNSDLNTYFFNASVLNESYVYTYKPITFDWDKQTNDIVFL